MNALKWCGPHFLWISLFFFIVYLCHTYSLRVLFFFLHPSLVLFFLVFAFLSFVFRWITFTETMGIKNRLNHKLYQKKSQMDFIKNPTQNVCTKTNTQLLIDFIICWLSLFSYFEFSGWMCRWKNLKKSWELLQNLCLRIRSLVFAFLFLSLINFQIDTTLQTFVRLTFDLHGRR